MDTDMDSLSLYQYIYNVLIKWSIESKYYKVINMQMWKVFSSIKHEQAGVVVLGFTN